MEAPIKLIEHEIGGVRNDALRFGLHGVKSEIVGSHPLESAYQSVCVCVFSVERIVYVCICIYVNICICCI